MVALALAHQYLPNLQDDDPFWALFPHRFDYIYAPHPEPNTTPQWQTETRHPLTNRLLDQGSYLYGVRFGQQTQYVMLDIDKGSSYHPDQDSFALHRIAAALEPIGLTRALICTSSYSRGLHVYFPFPQLQSTWQVGTVITLLLENAGLIIKPGLLEVFPNRKPYTISNSISKRGAPDQDIRRAGLFNAHRLPLQAGSYLLNSDLEPIWSHRHSFAQQWQQAQQQNSLTLRALKQVLRRSQRRTYQISGKAAKFLNDLNAEIELGWTDYGQTNYLLGRIALRTYIFHHVLTDESPLEGRALVNQIVAVAQALPGYQDWCRHQHELEHRASEWARCVEASRYFPYGHTKIPQPAITSKCSDSLSVDQPEPTWNQKQAEDSRNRIRQGIIQLLNQNALPSGISARFKALTRLGIGGSSLYRHKDLWHPSFLQDAEVMMQNIDQTSEYPVEQATGEYLEHSIEQLSEENSAKNQPRDQSIEQGLSLSPDFSSCLNLNNPTSCSASSTNLFPPLGRNPLHSQIFERFNFKIFSGIGSNILLGLALTLWALNLISTEIRAERGAQERRFVRPAEVEPICCFRRSEED